MKLAPKLLVATAATLFFVGCETRSIETSATRNANRDAETAGSPYRYRVRNGPSGKIIEKYRVVAPNTVVVPANLQQTSADAKVKNDILAEIANLQSQWGDSTLPILLGVEPLEKNAEGVKEAWFVKARTGALRFEVSLTQRSDGPGFTIMTP